MVYRQVQIFHIAPMLFYVFLKRITIIIYFPKIKYYVLFQTSYGCPKDLYRVFHDFRT